MRTYLKQFSIITFLFAIISTQSCGISEKDGQESNHEAITAINNKFGEAYKSKNGEAIQELYVSSGTLIAPYGVYKGNEEIRRSFERDFNTHQSIEKAEMKIDSIQVNSDTLLARGRFHIIGIKIENRTQFELEGPYTHKCIKQNGEWKILITSFTADININDY